MLVFPNLGFDIQERSSDWRILLYCVPRNIPIYKLIVEKSDEAVADYFASAA